MRRPLSTIFPRRSAQRPSTFRRRLLGRPSWTGVLARCIGLLLALGLLVAPTNAFSTSAGAFTIAPGQSRTLEVAERAQDAYGSVKFVVPEQRTVWMALQFRAASAAHGYRTRVRVLPNGAVWAGFSRVADGQETLLVSEPTPLTVQTGQTVVIEGKVIGTDPVAALGPGPGRGRSAGGLAADRPGRLGSAGHHARQDAGLGLPLPGRHGLGPGVVLGGLSDHRRPSGGPDAHPDA